MGYSVTQRISKVKQEKGGCIPIKKFVKLELEHSKELFPMDQESISATTVGLIVDYMTRFVVSGDKMSSFHISLLGATLANAKKHARSLLKMIEGNDAQSVQAAAVLVQYDAVCRAGANKLNLEQHMNDETIANVMEMIQRTTDFIEKYGPVTTFEPVFTGGYSEVISAGDGDWMTEDTLWDLKVTKSNPTTKHSLQLLTYYVLGCHSNAHEKFDKLRYLGIYNPRLDVVYRVDISEISKEKISFVEEKVICYGRTIDDVLKEELIEIATKDIIGLMEMSKLFGISSSIIKRNIEEGNLKAEKKGNRYLITKENAYQFAERYQKEQTKTRQKKKYKRFFSKITQFIITIICLLYVYYMFSR